MLYSSELSLPPASAGFLHALLFDPEGGDDVCLWNVEFSLNYTKFQSRRLFSSQTPVWEPQNQLIFKCLHKYFCVLVIPLFWLPRWHLDQPLLLRFWPLQLCSGRHVHSEFILICQWQVCCENIYFNCIMYWKMEWAKFWNFWPAAHLWFCASHM
jgi:hypothetical protein